MLLYEHQFQKWGKKILFNGIAREVLLVKPPKSKHMPNIKRNVWSVFSVHSSVSVIIKEKDRCTNFIHFYLKFLFPYFTSSNQHSIYSENIAISDKYSHYIHVFFFQGELILFLVLTGCIDLVIFYIDSRLLMLRILNQPLFNQAQFYLLHKTRISIINWHLQHFSHEKVNLLLNSHVLAYHLQK